METYKLRMKIGEHEFEAEGSESSVKEQFGQFKELLAQFPSRRPFVFSSPIKTIDTSATPADQTTEKKTVEPSLAPVFDLDAKKGLVTLKTKPTGERALQDALLLTLLGFRLVRGDDEVMVTSLKDSLEKTGFKVERVDWIADPCLRQGWVLKGGKGKGGKYSLTNAGLEQSQKLLDGLLNKVG